jgi:hypothetical protein
VHAMQRIVQLVAFASVRAFQIEPVQQQGNMIPDRRPSQCTQRMYSQLQITYSTGTSYM